MYGLGHAAVARTGASSAVFSYNVQTFRVPVVYVCECVVACAHVRFVQQGQEDFLPLRNGETEFGAHPATHSMIIGVLSRW